MCWRVRREQAGRQAENPTRVLVLWVVLADATSAPSKLTRTRSSMRMGCGIACPLKCLSAALPGLLSDRPFRYAWILEIEVAGLDLDDHLGGHSGLVDATNR
jgi:hypothetical protein